MRAPAEPHFALGLHHAAQGGARCRLAGAVRASTAVIEPSSSAKSKPCSTDRAVRGAQAFHFEQRHQRALPR